ncbi:hypothetical protein ACMX2M_20730 [Paenibacillus polymyxa]
MITNNKLTVDEAVGIFYSMNKLPDFIDQYDKNFVDLKDKVHKWIDQFENKHQEMFLTLFSQLKYFDTINIKKWFKEAYNEYLCIESSHDESIFMPITSTGGIMNGAVHILSEFDSAGLNISRKKVAAQPVEFNNSFKMDNAKNIVLLDDIIGSGDTLLDFILSCLDNEHTKKIFHNKKVYIFCLVVTERAKVNVENVLEYMGYECCFISKFTIDKALKQGVIFADKSELAEVKKVVKKYEQKAASEDKFIMGYKDSQALISFHFNTPNNTFSTFWESCEVKPWFSVFPRRKDEIEFELKKEEQVRLQHIKDERKRIKKEISNIKEQIENEKKKRLGDTK